MTEYGLIKKETINNALDEFIDAFINDLIEKENKFIDREGVGNYLNGLHNIVNLLNNINPDLIIERLEMDEIEEVRREFDHLNDSSNNGIVKGAVQLFISIELLKIQPFIQNTSNYDIFLSHCSWDAREVLGIKLLLEYKYDKKVYVDWIDDKQANYPRAIDKIIGLIKEIGPTDSVNKLNEIYKKKVDHFENKYQVNRESLISNLIISKLYNSTSLFYIQSKHYDYSRWMPFELGLAESKSKIVYRLPIKYQRARKKYGKRSGFLMKYDTIIGYDSEFKTKEVIDI